MWDDAPAGDGGVRSDGDWHRDAWVVRALWTALARDAGGRGRPGPADRDELMTALLATRDSLRRRLLLAEGVDPGTGQPVA